VTDGGLPDGLRLGFRREAEELAERITRSILALESGAGGGAQDETYKQLLRALHTLKGSAALVGLADVAEVAHAMEDTVLPLRAELLAMPAAVADHLLEVLDAVMTGMRTRSDDDGSCVLDTAALVARLRAVEVAPATAPAGRARPAAREPPPPAAAAATQATDHSRWQVSERQVLTIIERLELLREVDLRLAERRRDLARVVGEIRDLADGARRGKLFDAAAVTTRLAQVSYTLDGEVQDLHSASEGLDEAVRAVSTVGLAQVVEPLYRAVRDLARTCHKQVSLAVVGGELAIDRRLAEALRGPLLHLVRNAVDHGIETPELRQQGGKAALGTVTLRFEQQGNVLFVEASDDGAGLDFERIRAVARERDVVSAAELETFDEAQVTQLIFRAGFSTATQVTETSGRGVGLDVVRTQLEAVDGRVEVKSTRGQGSHFAITVPMRLGTSPVLIVRVANQNFGVPILAVETALALRAEHLVAAGATWRLRYREQVVPVLDLGVLCGLRRPTPPKPGAQLLVLAARERRVALLVDAVVADREVVLRPLPAELDGEPAFVGLAALAQGGVIAVLQPDWLVDAQRQRQVQAPLRGQVLVVDDSLTARALHRAILEAGGYAVHAVASAEEALNEIAAETYDLVVCDVSLTGIDGPTFVKRLRAQSATRTLPVILASMDATANARQEGLTAGADAYLSKEECAAGRLLAEAAAVLTQRGAV